MKKQLGFFKFQKNEAQEWELESQSIKKEMLKFPVPPIRIECDNR